MAQDRLNKAKQQFESLLLNAKGIEIDIHPDRYTTRTSTVATPQRTPKLSAPRTVFVPGMKQNTSTADCEVLVIHLQEEIDRLKSKINDIISEAEINYKEFQSNEEELRAHFLEVEQRNAAKMRILEEENILLRNSVESCREIIASEKKQLANAVRIIERLQRREREMQTQSSLSAVVQNRGVI